LVGSGFCQFEDWVGLGVVAFLKLYILDPDDVASGVLHHVDVFWWDAHADSHEYSPVPCVSLEMIKLQSPLPTPCM
jgi:hypothetical protein